MGSVPLPHETDRELLMVEVLTEQLSFGRYSYGIGTEGSNVRKLLWLNDLIPVVYADFAGSSYYINGVQKIYSDLFAASAQGKVSLLTNIGLSLSAGTAASASDTMVATAALNNAIPAGLSVSGVMDVTAVDTTDFASAVFFGGANNVQIGPRSGSVTLLEGAGTVNLIDPDTMPSGFVRVAFTISPTKYSLCFNGGAVVTAVPSVNPNLLTAFRQYLFTTASIVIKNLKLYPAQSDIRLRSISVPP